MRLLALTKVLLVPGGDGEPAAAAVDRAAGLIVTEVWAGIPPGGRLGGEGPSVIIPTFRPGIRPWRGRGRLGAYLLTGIGPGGRLGAGILSGISPWRDGIRLRGGALLVVSRFPPIPCIVLLSSGPVCSLLRNATPAWSLWRWRNTEPNCSLLRRRTAESVGSLCRWRNAEPVGSLWQWRNAETIGSLWRR